MFLVTGFPKSGTQYVAGCLRAAGYRVGHENRREDGVVSWKELPNVEEFRKSLFIIRNPLHVMRSGMTITRSSMNKLGCDLNGDKLTELLKAWIRWFKECERVCEGPFKVED